MHFGRHVPKQAAFLALCFAIGGCGATPAAPLAVQLPVTDPEQQTVGNCWIQTVVGWAESLVARAGQTLPHYSASYLTYRFLEDSLGAQQWGVLDDVSGTFIRGVLLVKRHGMLPEGSFRGPGGALPKSDSDALEFLRKAAAAGRFRHPVTPEAVRSALDEAYGIVMAEVERSALSAQSIRTGMGTGGAQRTLETELLSWQPITWVLGDDVPPATLQNAFARQVHTERQKVILQRAKRALGAGYVLPVAWYVDFNALDASGVFSGARWRESGGIGSQGAHSSLWVDYEAQLPSGERIPEGDVSGQVRMRAEENGVLTSIVLKNSWGAAPGAENHPTYRYLGRSGFTRVEADYLFAWIPEVHPTSREVFRMNSALTSVVLPPGF